MSRLPSDVVLTVETLSYEHVAKTIDHSLLRPELTDAELTAGCKLAQAYHVASVCIKPSSVPLAARLLQGGDVLVGTVVGFPHGSSTTRVKVYEARQALEEGSAELDMVINIGWLCSGEDQRVEDDIRAVVSEAAGKALVKVILETAYLTDDEKRGGCRIVEAAGAKFGKTPNGFPPPRPTRGALALLP